MAGFLSLDELFEGRHFDREIIVLCVRWYLRFKLSFRDLVEMMAERNLSMAHTTIMRWVHHYAPEFERRWNRFARPAGSSWRVDETYVKIRGQWVYLYRAVDRAGKTVDFRLSSRRDVAAAKAFFRKAVKSQGSTPTTITLDGYAASHRAVREMQADGQLAAVTPSLTPAPEYPNLSISCGAEKSRVALHSRRTGLLGTWSASSSDIARGSVRFGRKSMESAKYYGTTESFQTFAGSFLRPFGDSLRQMAEKC
jgi:transposase-like protein